MRKKIWLAVCLFHVIIISRAQDSVKVKKREDGSYCTLLLCAKQECYPDTVPAAFFNGDKKTELRINDKCSIKKKTDVFVSSFEVHTEKEGKRNSVSAQSSFFNDAQLNSLKGLGKGDAFNINNIVIHGPDGFSKMDDIRIIIK